MTLAAVAASAILSIRAVAHYSLSLDHCFPVLLSVKKDGHALALCAHWGEAGHTSLSSEKHVAPKEWNFQYVCAHMAAKAAGVTLAATAASATLSI